MNDQERKYDPLRPDGPRPSDFSHNLGPIRDTMPEERRLDHVFSYHAPDEEDRVKYERIRRAAKEFTLVIMENTPRCADQTVAIRKTREAVMTANAAIALKGIS